MRFEMKIKLDGKNNLFDQGYEDLKGYTHESKGGLSEEERHRIMKEVNEKVTHDYHNKPIFRMDGLTTESDYTKSYDMTKAKNINNEIKEEKPMKKTFVKIYDNVYMKVNSLEKASTHKYIKRLPHPSGKGYIYFYNQKQIKDYKEKGTIPGEEKKSILSGIMKFFGLSDEKKAQEKIKETYESNKKELAGVGISTFTEYMNEYLSNKEKWDKKFSSKGSEKKDKTEKKSSISSDKKTVMSDKGGSKWNMGLMKKIAGIVGGGKDSRSFEKDVKKMSDEDLQDSLKELKKKMSRLDENDDTERDNIAFQMQDIENEIEDREFSGKDNFDTMPDDGGVSILKTEEEILTDMGAKIWETNNMKRAYFNNLEDISGLSINRYNTGNVSSATFNGETISNSQAKRMIPDSFSKFWYDFKDKKFHGKGLHDDVFKNIKEKLREELDNKIKENEPVKDNFETMPEGEENIAMDTGKMRSVKMPKEIKSKGIGSKEYKEWVKENWSKSDDKTGIMSGMSQDEYFSFLNKKLEDIPEKKEAQEIRKKLEDSEFKRDAGDRRRLDIVMKYPKTKEQEELSKKLTEKTKQFQDKEKEIKEEYSFDKYKEQNKTDKSAVMSGEEFSKDYKKFATDVLNDVKKNNDLADYYIERTQKDIKQSGQRIKSIKKEAKPGDDYTGAISKFEERIKDASILNRKLKEITGEYPSESPLKTAADELEKKVGGSKESDKSAVMSGEGGAEDQAQKEYDRMTQEIKTVEEKLKEDYDYVKVGENSFSYDGDSDPETIDKLIKDAGSDNFNNFSPDFIADLKKYKKNIEEIKPIKEKLMGPKMFKARQAAALLLLESLEKGKKVPIGTVNKSGYTKVAEGKWVKKGKSKGEKEPGKKPEEKKPEVQKDPQKEAHKEKIKNALKKIATIFSDALSMKDTVQPTGQAVEESGSAMSRNKKPEQKKPEPKKSEPKKKPEDKKENE